MTDPEVIAKDLLIAFLSSSDSTRVPAAFDEGAKTGTWIGEAYVALVKTVRAAREARRADTSR